MTEQPPPEAVTTALPLADVTLNAAVTRPRRAAMGFVLGGGLLAIVAACVGLICVLSFFASILVNNEQDDVAGSIDAVMSAMAARDVASAQILFAASVQGAQLKSNLQSNLNGAAFALYAGYSGVELSNITIGMQSATDPSEPNGIVARVSGYTHYEDGFVGTFDAALVREQGTWKLWSLNIDIAPDRIDAYLNSQP